MLKIKTDQETHAESVWAEMKALFNLGSKRKAVTE
jgi:hypothetical protein